MRLSLLPSDAVTPITTLPVVKRIRAEQEVCEEVKNAAALWQDLAADGKVTDDSYVPIAIVTKRGNGSQRDNAELMALVAKMNRHGKREEYGFKFNVRTTVDADGTPVLNDERQQSYTLFMTTTKNVATP